MIRQLTEYGFFSILILALIGCAPDERQAVPEILSITPPDGASDVAKTTSIQVEFSEPMHTQSCESRFSLHMGQHTSISMMIQGLQGHFAWNDDESVMTFHTDSTLTDSTMYSICLKEGMETHHHGGSLMMSGMMGQGMESEGGIISHFETK